MKTKIHAESFGQEYAIVEDKCSYTVLRKLPDSEYWEYYRERLDELCMDGEHAYWLPIHHTWAQEDAEQFLLGIGVECGAWEASSCGKDEGCLTISGRNVKAILRAATLLIMLLICIAPCVMADEVLVAQIAPDPSPAPIMSEEPAPDMSAMPTILPIEPQGEAPEPSDTSAIVPKPEPIPIPSLEPLPIVEIEPIHLLSPDQPPPLEPEHAPELATESMSDLSLAPTLDPLSHTTVEDEEAQDGQGDGTGLVLTRNKPRLDWTGVVPANDGGMPIPRLYQYRYKTVLCNYDGIPRSVMTSGCNVTCVAMVVAYLTGAEHSPEKLFSWALRNNLYHGNGLGHSEMSKVAAKYGVSGKWIARDGDAVIDALKAGKPVIAHMAPGLFAKNGHYIVLRGVTEDGMILVNDPGSAGKSKFAYPMKTILRETRTGSPFMVCEVSGKTKEH